MAGKTTNAGFLFNETDTTGANFVSLPQSPSIITLFIDISATASLTIALRDSEKTGFIPVRTITTDAIVKIALPATQLQVSITANTGLVTVTYRINVTENFPSEAIEVFTPTSGSGGSPGIEPQIINVTGTLTTDITPDEWLKLAQVEIAATPTTIYTVPALTQTDVLTIILASTSVTDQIVTLWHDGSADANLIFPPSTILAGGQAVFSGHILMQPGDTLVADCDAATAVTITVYGKEQDTP